MLERCQLGDMPQNDFGGHRVVGRKIGGYGELPHVGHHAEGLEMIEMKGGDFGHQVLHLNQNAYPGLALYHVAAADI